MRNTCSENVACNGPLSCVARVWPGAFSLSIMIPRDSGRRDYASLVLLARLGLRRGEVAALRLDDIDWKRGEIAIRGKGNQHDPLPLPVDVAEALIG